MTSSLSPSFLCPACSGENARDSRFCRHCGATLDGVETLKTSTASAPAVSAGNDTSHEALTSPSEIDARHARQLLDRAFYLSERGDTGGAILACRQSIALAPAVASGHSMLGLLLERNGDFALAAAAYEKAVQLAPHSTLERDSLLRLREKLEGQQSSSLLFHFYDNELYSDASQTSTSTANPTAKNQDALNSPNGNAKASAAVAGLTSIGAAAPGLPRAYESAAPLGAHPQGANAPHLPYSSSQAPVAATPIFLPDTEVRPSGWRQMWVRPSFYGRSLPLVGATILALGFLTWARSWAVARAVTNTSQTALAPADPVNILPADPSSSTGTPASPAATAGSQAASGGFPVSNRPLGPATTQSTGSQPTGNQAPAPQLARIRAGATRSNGSSGSSPRLASSPRRPSPQFPQVIPPARIVPATRTNPAASARSSAGSASLGLPAPNIAAPAPVPPPVAVLPSGNTPALNPAGQAGRGYVRITRGSLGASTVPAGSNAQANSAERGAATAARAGQNDRAIDQLTSAINNDAGDAGFRFQQRATLFLDRGDYSRAADDFQSAISAYNDQIARGEQVASARAGLRAARSGLNLALAGGR